MLQKFVLSISTTAPAGQIGLNERVAGMVKPSAGASNKGRLFISALTLFSQYLLNILFITVLANKAALPATFIASSCRGLNHARYAFV